MPKKWILTGLVCAVLGLLDTGSFARADLIDPTGDTFGSQPIQQDITNYNAVFNYGANTIQFTVNFDGAISPASAFAPNSVVGFVEIDTDRNPATGNTSPLVNAFAGPPPFNLGSEVLVDVGSEAFHPGLVDVLDSTTFALLGQVPITFGPNGFGFDLSVNGLLGGNWIVNYALVFGTFLEPTDRAPNGATPAQSVPEPTSLLLFGFAGTAAVCYGWKRRRRSGQPV